MLIDAQENKIIITATDLDIIFYDEINEVKIEKTVALQHQLYSL